MINSMLMTLAEQLPERFTYEHFNDTPIALTDKLLNWKISVHTRDFDSWIMGRLPELQFGEIYKMDGLTWEESLLNAIVCEFVRRKGKENPND